MLQFLVLRAIIERYRPAIKYNSIVNRHPNFYLVSRQNKVDKNHLIQSCDLCRSLKIPIFRYNVVKLDEIESKQPLQIWKKFAIYNPLTKAWRILFCPAARRILIGDLEMKAS